MPTNNPAPASRLAKQVLYPGTLHNRIAGHSAMLTHSRASTHDSIADIWGRSTPYYGRGGSGGRRALDRDSAALGPVGVQMNGHPSAQNTRECGANGEMVAFRNFSNVPPSPRRSPRAHRRDPGGRGLHALPYGTWDTGGRPRAANELTLAANELTLTTWNPISKQPACKGAAVRVSPVANSARPTDREKHSCRWRGGTLLQTSPSGAHLQRRGWVELRPVCHPGAPLALLACNVSSTGAGFSQYFPVNLNT